MNADTSDSRPKWTAIVLAGQRPGPDRLAAHFGETWKALVTIDGEPMLTRVVRTLTATPAVARTIVLAQDPNALQQAASDGGTVDFCPSSAGISQSILRVAGGEKAPWPVLVTTADHPLLTPSIVSAFIEQAGHGDVSIGMVERQVMHAAYPENRRTWLKFSDGHWSGANLFALNSEAARGALNLWSQAEQDRKKAWKLFLHFGPWLALRAVTRTIGLADALRAAGNRLGLEARLVPLSNAEATIDVDKLSDYRLAEEILKRRALT